MNEEDETGIPGLGTPDRPTLKPVPSMERVSGQIEPGISMPGPPVSSLRDLNLFNRDRYRKR